MRPLLGAPGARSVGIEGGAVQAHLQLHDQQSAVSVPGMSMTAIVTIWGPNECAGDRGSLAVRQAVVRREDQG